MIGRLVEVWSEQVDGAGRSGSGWVVGTCGVLTAKHVVDPCAAIQVRSAGSTASTEWVDAVLRWSHPQLDAALLEVAPGDGQSWQDPVEPSPRLAAVGARASPGEAIGFPNATVRLDGLRGADHASGRFLPGGGARDAEGLIPFDVDASVPEEAELWEGFSGTAVQDEHERLVAIVVKVHPNRQQRRLLVLPVEELAVGEAFERAAVLVGLDPVVEDRRAPAWRASVVPRSLARSGTPMPFSQIDNPRVLGVHAAVAADTGTGAYPPYVARDRDAELAEALSEATSGGRRVVLVVGDSAAGKSRSAAEAARRDPNVAGRGLVVPRADRGLTRLVDEGVRLDGMLVWLDDLDKYLGGLDPEVLSRLLDETPDVVIVATIRRSQLQSRQESLADPAWQFLTNEEYVTRIDLQAVLTEPELAAARTEFSTPALIAALERRVGLGEYLVGGPELVKRLELASGLDKHVADVVVDWYRTGLKHPIPLSDLRRLWIETLPETLATPFRELGRDHQDQRFQAACAWACDAIMSRDAHEVALVSARDDGYEASDYVVDHVSRQSDRPVIAQAVWNAALAAASSDETTQGERLWRVGVAAHDERQPDVALSTMRLLANLGEAGDAVAAYNVGVLLGELERLEDAIASYEQVVSRFGDAADPALREVTAKALVNRAVSLGKLGRSEEELAGYDDVVRRFGEAADPALRDQTAKALVNRAVTFDQLGRSEEALAGYDDVVRRFGEAADPALRDQTAKALVNRAVTFGKLGRSEEELAGYDDVIARFGEATDPALRDQTAKAIFNKAITLGELGRHEEELAGYDDVVDRFADATDPALRDQTAKALVNRAATLSQLGRHEVALAGYEDVMSRIADDPDLELRLQTAKALFGRAVTLGELGRHEEALADYDDMVRRFGEATDPALRDQTAKALFGRAVMLGELGRHEEALAGYDDVVRRFGEATEPTLRDQTAKALFNKAVTLGKLGRYEEALAGYEDIVSHIADATDSELRLQIARALLGRAVTLGKLGRYEEALAGYDDMVRRFGEATDPALGDQTAKALFNRAVTLGNLGRAEEELAGYDDIVSRFGEATDPALLDQTAKALFNRAVTLGELGRAEEELAGYDDIVSRFGEATDPMLHELAAKALSMRTASPL
jgi:tetratricopeptide (TPR) repeat protein